MTATRARRVRTPRQARPRHRPGPAVRRRSSRPASSAATSAAALPAGAWRRFPVAQLRRVDGALQELPRLPVTDAAHRRQRRVECVAFAAARASSSTSPASSIASKRVRDCRMQHRAIGGHERNRERWDPASRPLPRACPAMPRAAARSSGGPRARAGCAAHRWASSRAAVAGSTRASSACSAGQPSRAARGRVRRARRHPRAATPTGPRSAP